MLHDHFNGNVEFLHSFYSLDVAKLQTCVSHISVIIPSLIITSHIQILQHDQHLVSMGTGSQTGRDATALIGGVILVPVCLQLVGSDFTCMGAVCVPASRVLGLLWKLDVFDDHRGPLAAL